MGYLVLLVALTWPLALSPTRAIVANHGDGFFDMLLFWYARHGALLQPRVDTLFFPWGVPLGPEQGYWLVPYLSIPLQCIMPLPAAYNLLCLLFFVGTGTATYALARELDATPVGSFIAGALLLLSPAYLNEMAQGIPENMGMQWLILYLWCGVRLRRAPHWGVSLGAGGLFALTWFGSWYLGVFAVIFTLLLPLRRLAPGLVLGGLLVVVPVWSAVQGGLARPGPRYDSAVIEQYRAGQVPQDEEKWRPLRMGPTSVRAHASIGVLRNSVDYSRFPCWQAQTLMQDLLPTILTLCLAGLGLWMRPRETRTWAGLVFLLACLSLGPYLIWRGEAVARLPVAGLYDVIPALARLRPVRHLLGMSLALALMAAFAVPLVKSRAVAILLVVGVVGMQAHEALVMREAHYRIHLAPAEVPAWYERLAGDASRPALIEVPFEFYGLQQGRHLYFQTVHGKPMFNYNFVTEASQLALLEKIEENSLLGFLAGVRPGVERKDVEELRSRGIRYIVLHTTVPRVENTGEDRAFFSPLLHRGLVALCGPPEDAGDSLCVFDLQKVKDDAWTRAGHLQPGRPPFCLPDFDFHPAKSAPRAVGSAPADQEYGEMSGWLFGRGVQISAWQGGVCVGRFTCPDEHWHWFSVPLGTRGSGPPDPPGPLELLLTIPEGTVRGGGRHLVLWPG